MKLTKCQKDILEKMIINRDNEDGELVYEKRQCYLGCDRVDSRILYGLLRVCAISLDQYSDINNGMERYTINDTGIQLLNEI